MLEKKQIVNKLYTFKIKIMELKNIFNTYSSWRSLHIFTLDWKHYLIQARINKSGKIQFRQTKINTVLDGSIKSDLNFNIEFNKLIKNG